MEYGLLDYKEGLRTFNIGDYIQSLAAKQFLPKIDVFVNREELGKYEGDNIKMILNGWFTHNAENWIPSEDIDPLFISFHMNSSAAPQMLSQEGINYLKKHEPIGCRDHYTVKLLHEKGVDAYFSGCLTLTLDKYKVDDSERENKIYIVDPLYGYNTLKKVLISPKTILRNMVNGEIFKIRKRELHLKKIISAKLLKSAIYVDHEPRSRTYTNEQKFEMAEDLLYKYARARLVITSRIHCALPCLAMGTPVIFLNGFMTFSDSCRFKGIIDLFNRVDINPITGEWSTNFDLKGVITANTVVQNPSTYYSMAEEMKNTCRHFVENS